MTNIERIGAFLDNAKSYMFVGGGLAFCAPFGSHFWVDDKLYFRRGINGYLPEGIKDISKVEIAAVGDGEYLSYSGDPKYIEDGALIELPRNAYSEIMEYCEKKEKKCIIFYIENGHARFLDENLELKEEFDV